MSYQKAIVTLLALLVVALAVWTQQQRLTIPGLVTHGKEGDSITPELKGFIEDLRHSGNIPGLSLAVVHYDGRIESIGFGSSTEDGDHATADTLFNIASCSKAFLAGSLGILMDDFAAGRNATPLPLSLESFNWHTKLKDLLPHDWGMMDEWAHEKATIRDILTHVSGLPRHDFSYTPSDTPLDLIRRMRHLRPSFELREKHQYVNQMYVLATHIVALYSGITYIDFVKQRIFNPLGMTSSTFSEVEARKNGQLSHAFSRDGRRVPFWFPDSVKDLTAGPGGIISNAVDMAKWIQMLLHKGVDSSTNTTVLPPSVYQSITTAHSVASAAPYPEFSDTGYGFGWSKYSYQGHEHNGAIPGYSTQAVFLPQDGLGIVVLCNASQKEKQAMAVVYRAIESILGLPHTASSRFVASESQKSHGLPKSVTPNGSDEESKSDDSEGVMKRTATYDNISLERYVGTYANPGYPNITICSPAHVIPSGQHELGNICSATLKAFSVFDDLSIIGPTLYLAIPGVWIRNARLTISGPHRFNVASTYLFPEGYGKDKTPFELSEMVGFMGNVEFAVDEGGGVVGLAMDHSDVTEVTRHSGVDDIRSKAGVWFERV